MSQIVQTSVTRRQFIIASASAAGGLMISVSFLRSADAAGVPTQAWGADIAQNEINAFLAIDPDGTILIRSPHQEMGQGALTALPMIVAEELECDWSKVKVEHASPARNLKEKNVYGAMTTVGSRGVRTSWQMLLQAGASARVRLIAAAAQRWNVPVTECEAANNKVTHKSSGRNLDYGALAADAAKVKLDKEPEIRTPDQFKFIGKSVARLDTPLKINGSAGGSRASTIRLSKGDVVCSRWSGSTMPLQSSPIAFGAPRKRLHCLNRNGMRAKPARLTARSSPSSIAIRSTARW
jgi:isoquinoline 1-oxidoreductase beta subunit